MLRFRGIGVVVAAVVWLPGVAVAGNVPTGDYVGIYNFRMEIDGVIVAGFQEAAFVEGPQVTILDDGDRVPFPSHLLAPSKWPNLVLRHGFVGPPADEMKLWYLAAMDACDAAGFAVPDRPVRGAAITCDPIPGSPVRKSGSIIVLDNDDAQIARYDFFEAWPMRWRGPAVQSMGDTHTVEEIELALEKWEEA